MLDPKLLRYFVEVADTRSFSQAADHLGVTQSWLSRQVVKLEQQIGFRLFDRTSRTVILTADGRALLCRARQAVDQVTGVQALATQMAQRQWSLVMGVPTYALLAEPRLRLCDRYLRSYPRVQLDTRIDSFRELAASLARGELDLAFTIPLERLSGDPQIETLTVASGGLDVVFGVGDPFEAEAEVTLDQVARRHVAAFSRRSNADLYTLIFQPAVDAGSMIIEFSDYSFHRHLGDHAAITLMPTWQPLPAANLRRRRLVGLERAVDLAMLRMRAHRPPALEAFWRLAAGQGG